MLMKLVMEAFGCRLAVDILMIYFLLSYRINSICDVYMLSLSMDMNGRSCGGEVITELQ
jgi:hypothetical protein